MSSTYQDEGPIPWFRTEQCIFYIVFFVVFPFFFVNIFVALIIVTFNELGEAELEDDIDKNQKSCINFAIQARPLQLYVPDDTSGPRYEFSGKYDTAWDWLQSQVSHLETRHLTSFRKFCPALDHPEHLLTDAQVPWCPTVLCGYS